MGFPQAEFPKIDLSNFFLSVSAAAIQSLQEKPADLIIARHNIDLLELMSEKTRGNRSPEEDQLLQQLLFQLRIAYVEAEKK